MHPDNVKLFPLNVIIPFVKELILEVVINQQFSQLIEPDFIFINYLSKLETHLNNTKFNDNNCTESYSNIMKFIDYIEKVIELTVNLPSS